MLNLLWVLWQNSSADLDFEEEEKARKDLKKLEKNDEMAATALMG